MLCVSHNIEIFVSSGHMSIFQLQAQYVHCLGVEDLSQFAHSDLNHAFWKLMVLSVGPKRCIFCQTFQCDKINSIQYNKVHHDSIIQHQQYLNENAHLQRG